VPDLRIGTYAQARRCRKLRSDAIIATDSRAAVVTIPPGQNPADYTQTRGGGGGRGSGRGRAGRRRGGGGGGGRGGKKASAGGGMDVDA
jgi:hypothetical protein